MVPSTKWDDKLLDITEQYYPLQYGRLAAAKILHGKVAFEARIFPLSLWDRTRGVSL